MTFLDFLVGAGVILLVGIMLAGFASLTVVAIEAYDKGKWWGKLLLAAIVLAGVVALGACVGADIAARRATQEQKGGE